MAYNSIKLWPNAARHFAEAPYDDNAWVNMTLAYTDDVNSASVSVSTMDTGLYTNVIVMGGYGFTSGTAAGTRGMPTSPEKAIVTGIGVNILKHRGTAAIIDALVQLTKDGTFGVGSNLASSGTWGTNVGGTYGYGGSNNLWGCTRFAHPDDFGTGFGVRFSARALQDNADPNLDTIDVTVYYQTLGGIYGQATRRGRILQSPDGDASNITSEYVKTATGTMGTGRQAVPINIMFAPSGTHSTAWSGGTFSSAGTCELAIGSAGTVGYANTLGLGREIYFCSTAGTSKAMPTGMTAFVHYYVSTRGSSSTSFTFCTSPTGTAGTQQNLTGTTGTHSLWIRNP